MNNGFKSVVETILKEEFGDKWLLVYKTSDLIKYLLIKTKAADKGSKSRASFGNLYAIYVLIEDYIINDFISRADYSKYEGAQFSQVFKRQRELPFGSKLQNHALNHRLNEEYRKYNRGTLDLPIIREPVTNRYWINENLIIVDVDGNKYNIAKAIIKIINAYIEARRESFDNFIETAEKLKTISSEKPSSIEEFIYGLLAPNIDARIFEIVSYSILKYSYINIIVYFGYELDKLNKEELKLYKTGRTNANDGGIDFVMKPLGRFFQVTETTDVKKYFLDIDKLEKFPITFVVKTEIEENLLKDSIREKAKEQYPVEEIVNKYMDCVEEIINIPKLKTHFNEALKNNKLKDILNEIIIQSRVEFNYDE
jgi:hypothetical protein